MYTEKWFFGLICAHIRVIHDFLYPKKSTPVEQAGILPARVQSANPSSRTALPFKMPGMTSGLKPATSKSFIQRSGVISG